MVNPAEDFVRLVSSELLGNRRFTPAARDQFTLITRRAFEQLVGERINDRLKGAMSPETVTVSDPVVATPVHVAPAQHVPTQEVPQLATSPEELEAFHTIRALVRGLVPSKRVVMRDAQSYCAILLDDNNRKPLCRLRFNNTEKLRVGIFNAAKDEEQFPLESVDDIHNFAEQLRATVSSYLQNAGSDPANSARELN